MTFTSEYAIDLKMGTNEAKVQQPGIGADGSDTYTPRALIYDTKTSFGTLRQTNALYEAQTDPLDGLHGVR
jgi:hypothetical protein